MLERDEKVSAVGHGPRDVKIYWPSYGPAIGFLGAKLAQLGLLFFPIRRPARYNRSGDECFTEKKTIAAICQRVATIVKMDWPASIVRIAMKSPPRQASAIGATRAGFCFAA